MHLVVMQFSRVMVLCIWGVALVQVLSFASSHFRALVASLIVVCTKLAHASLVWILRHMFFVKNLYRLSSLVHHHRPNHIWTVAYVKEN